MRGFTPPTHWGLCIFLLRNLDQVYLQNQQSSCLNEIMVQCFSGESFWCWEKVNQTYSPKWWVKNGDFHLMGSNPSKHHQLNKHIHIPWGIMSTFFLGGGAFFLKKFTSSHRFPLPTPYRLIGIVSIHWPVTTFHSLHLAWELVQWWFMRTQMLHGTGIFTQPFPLVHVAIFHLSCR